MRIRQANSGREFAGTAIRQVPVWDGTEWIPQLLPAAGPDRYVFTKGDLPEPDDDGVITLETGWTWNFVNTIFGDPGETILQPDGANVTSIPGTGGGGWVSNSLEPGFRSVNYINYQPFYTQNIGGGESLWCNAGNAVAHDFVSWYVPGPTLIDSGYFEWNLGRLDNVTVTANGGDKRFMGIRWMGAILVTGGVGRIDLMTVVNCGKIYGSGTTPLLKFDTGTYNLNKLIMSGCRSHQGGLLELPASYNQGVPWNNVVVSNCGNVANGTGNAINIIGSAAPLGGFDMQGCDFIGGTPIAGLSASSDRTFFRDNFDDGVKMTETVITP